MRERKAYIHYVRRPLHDQWFAEVQGRKQKERFERPLYHITRAVNGPASEVVEGDTIWLVAQLFSPYGELPPAIDARIEVSKVTRLEGGKGFKYEASSNSRWFPLASAVQLLSSDLETVSKEGPRKLWPGTRPIGHSLQRMRQLVTDLPLDQWESALNDRGFDFISYRLLDGTSSAFQVALDRVQEGKCVYWDLWSFPRGLVERREEFPELKEHIYSQIKKANAVLGVCTPLYGEAKSYSAAEMEYAKALGKFVSLCQEAEPR